MPTEFLVELWHETLYVVAEDELDGVDAYRLTLVDHGPREGSLATWDIDSEYYRYVVVVTNEDGDEVFTEEYDDLGDAQRCHADLRQSYIEQSDENRLSHRDQHVDDLAEVIDRWSEDSADTRLVRAVARLINRGRAAEVLADLLKHGWLIEN